ncbi:hypothetical protein A7U60_g7869 [Sanghuangporus baumii]|uniref:Uncharacterized protein n=1 Tax=Sanghuangporus baumii TaxID=108892 RepID=A0A9Q5HSL3_SANBA|nr:hypothetical protein A7U60_g7869 [Sanghuangporus baumii]
MENNDTDSTATSVAPQGSDKVERNSQPTSVTDKPTDPVSAPASSGAGHEDAAAAKESSTEARDSAESQPGSRDVTLVEAKPVGSVSTSATQSYVPPVKRFSAVNINKKFLQKNQTSTTASGGTSSGPSGSKQAGTIARPAPQSAHSHSRLITTKLTASPLSSSPAQGWSRPSSVTPPAPSPANASGPTKGTAPAIVPIGSHSVPHIAPGSRIIQPQVIKQKSDGSGRPAWRSVQPGSAASAIQAQMEFPTAAEAAQSRLTRLSEVKATSDSSDAHKQAMSESADAFRGVHLDPNAHHWDEMEEEDNDDFLGDVIEFGDGRQYTIHVSEDTKGVAKGLEDEGSVSKEERFVDDFDRSWPKSRTAPSRDELSQRGRASRSETSSNFSAHSPVSMRDGMQSRVLFNERSNRMEPIASGRPATSSYGPSRGPQIFRDRLDGPVKFHSNRIERDAPPHTAFQRPHESPWNHPQGPDQHARDLRELKAESPSSYFHSEHHDRKGRSEWSSGRSRGGPSPNGRAFSSRERSTSRSVNGAPSIASSDGHSSKYAPSIRDQHRGPPSPGHFRDADHQLAPHLAHPRSFAHPEKSPDIRTGVHREPASEAGSREQDQPQQGSHSPTHDAAASSIPPNDIEALRKAYLAESAERAKKRRQHEEEERMKAQERARKKAAELEAKMVAAKAVEASKSAPQSSETPDGAIPKSTVEESKQKPTEVCYSFFFLCLTKPISLLSHFFQAEVLRVIEGAINSAVSSEIPSTGKLTEPRREESDGQKSSFAKALFRGDGDRSVPSRDAQEASQPKRPQATATKADQVDSWRARSKPPVLPVENSQNDISQESAVSVIPDVRAFDIQPDESTEVIEFNDMSRLATERTQKLVPDAHSTDSKSAQPVANEVCSASVSPQKSEQDTWRKGDPASRRTYPATTGNGLGDGSQQRTFADGPRPRSGSNANDEAAAQRALIQGHSKTSAFQANGFVPPSTSNQLSHPSSPGAPRFSRPPNAPYREAPLSALDDTMSRIKGALDVMHTVHDHNDRESSSASTVRLPTPNSSPLKPSKWLPPALRMSGMISGQKRTDTFEPTHPEPPRSPAPPSNNLVIRLPKSCRRIEPLTKRQINYQKYFGPVRWEILSFEPPVEGMTKRSLSVNDVLFKKPQGPFKTRKYRVSLPKSKATPRQLSASGIQRSSSGISLTTTEVANFRDLSWHAASAIASAESTSSSQNTVAPTLDVTSRSPPPELVSKSERPPTISGVTSKPRSSSRSIDVTDVAFYRDARGQRDSKAAIPTVTFTVSSEIEAQSDGSPSSKTPILSTDVSKSSPGTVSGVSSSEVKTTPLPYPNSSMAPSSSTGLSSSVATSPQYESRPVSGVKIKGSDQQIDPFLQRQPATPPPQNTPSSWSKSPSRAPDPEHLKAVWSQAPDSDSVPAINSLKNIADDLPAVPFTLHEVKSEGGTPPPAPPGPVVPPTRMSASEVTRAFQTVPSGPSNGVGSTTLRNNQIPSNLSSPMSTQRALKPPTIGLPPPPSINASASRPPYMGFPTATTNHSPSPPTLVYSHILPNGIGGSPVSSPYGQPMWVPVIQQGAQMIRTQSSSPYSPSLMPYSIPAAQNGMYPQSNMLNSQSSPAAYSSAPVPPQMMVSPVLPHATAAPPNPMYPGSPMVVHVAPPGTSPQARPPYPPGPVGMGRASLPVQNPMDPRSQPAPGPPTAPPSRFPVHNPGYTPASQTFTRHW